MQRTDTIKFKCVVFIALGPYKSLVTLPDDSVVMLIEFFCQP